MVTPQFKNSLNRVTRRKHEASKRAPRIALKGELTKRPRQNQTTALLTAEAADIATMNPCNRGPIDDLIDIRSGKGSPKAHGNIPRPSTHLPL